jgi:hypothetical protein
MSDFKIVLFAGVPAAVAVALSFGCSSGAGSASAAPGAGNTHNAGGSAGAIFTSGGTTGSSGSTGFGGGFGATTSGGGFVATDGAACSTNTYSGERLPLDMYFLVDTSGSMQDKVQGGTKWSVVSAALTAFVNDPANADIDPGIGYFPLVLPNVPAFCTVDTDCATYGPCIDGFPVDGSSPPARLFGVCNGADVCQIPPYAMPSVPLQLPPNQAAVVNDIANHGPGGGTPTQPALSGTMQYVTGWAQAHPGRTSVIVLATDGEPTGCDTNTAQDVANVAAAGLAEMPSIRTFVIGVGNSLQNLDLIAAAGGTDKSIVVDTGGDVATQFTQALAAIRGQAVPCVFNIPSTGDVDPNQVNITYTPTGGTSTTIPRTTDGTAATCGAAGGWYYDDPSNPKTVRVCDTSCTAISASTSVNFEVGCATVVAPPS